MRQEAHPEAITQALIYSLPCCALKGSSQGVIAAQLGLSSHKLGPTLTLLTKLLRQHDTAML